MPREVRYWNSRQFFRVYGRDPSAKGFPLQDAEGFFLTMGYRIRLDDGQPEAGEPSPVPSAQAGKQRPGPSRRKIAPPEPAAPDAAAPQRGGRVSFRHFEHSGGFDGYEGRMHRPEMASTGAAPAKGGRR